MAIEPGAVPERGSPAYQRLLDAKMPIVIYYGDYIDNGPEGNTATEFWRGNRDSALSFAADYTADGGDCTVIELPKIGITGNSHMLFQELNNREIAEQIEAWLRNIE